MQSPDRLLTGCVAAVFLIDFFFFFVYTYAKHVALASWERLQVRRGYHKDHFSAPSPNSLIACDLNPPPSL